MKNSLIFLSLLACGLIVGCQPRTSGVLATQADTSFLKIIKEDLGLEAKVFWAGKTVWIYLPDDNREIFTISAASAASTPVKRKFALQYCAASFEGKTFLVEYDVVDATKAASAASISTQYSEAFNTQYRNLITALTRSYFGMDNPPDFIVVVLADTKKGMEIQNTICTLDLKKYYASTLAPDEYSIRVLSESKGDVKIIGDRQGKHLAITEISWPEFLAKQITQRVRYKFQNSQFPPEETPQGEILKVIATTMMIYDFHDYAAVVLNDLRATRAENFTRAQIEAMEDRSILGSEKAPSKGQIITIDFTKFMEGNKEGQGSTPEAADRALSTTENQ